MQGSIGGAGEVVGPLDVQSYGHFKVMVRISGTFSATLEVETKRVEDADAEYVAEESVSAAGVFLLDAVNPTSVRVRASAYTSGTANVAILPA